MAIRYDQIAERLRAYRLGKGLSTDEIALRLGLSRAAIYRMEKGELIKIETLERVSELLGVSLASLLDAGVEYHSNAVSFLERMRQIELTSERVLAHYEPISFMLASDAYDEHLRQMLLETMPTTASKVEFKRQVDEVLRILVERKAQVRQRQPNIASVIGLLEIERFLRLGLVGRLDLPASAQKQRRQAAAAEVERIARVMEQEPVGIQIGLVEGALPSQTFQIFRRAAGALVSVSPYRLGELPNITTGVATVTAAPEAVALHEAMFSQLWEQAVRGSAGAVILRKLIKRTAP
ncbi:helix-turn-helix transcriptional regulator [Vineibacter terrae]|uniref:helix-turn-helix domain-containing protein n=1 Tax=Vineibacter terrae TaxID=2586908 RepID=UPI002E30378C|nr:helix-turn-helix transcriptional regulator [Vineibacter terrae]HEX2884808.1 helix-turn-helix transcriptional regulator [Vineibacter terrae]